MSEKQQGQRSWHQDYLSSQFEQSRSDVARYAAWIEERYGRPVLHRTQSYYSEHPLFSVFAGAFILLSLPPTATFIGFCLIILTVLLLSALCSVIVVFTTIAFVLGSILLLVVLTNLLLSIFITFSLVAVYFSFKVALAGYTDGLRGARQQIVEFYHAFFSRVHAVANHSPKHDTTSAVRAATVDQSLEDSRSSSPDSTVIVNNSETNGGEPNAEKRSSEMKLEEQY
ncbi:hypothetical protein F5880DRAFT_377782 [Lentinula raphanica]|nr:hypothetical protein F5880DRAFT_377782 [Lentinula raphanica]